MSYSAINFDEKLVEPAGTINTGNVGGELEAEDNVWI
jgi:hypothetical protein